MRARTQTVELVEAGHIETSHFDDANKHPYRAWIWLGVFAVGAAFWVGVGLGIHALVQ